MTYSNLEPWEEALLLMPELDPSDSLSNKSYPLSYDNSYEPDLGLYAKLKRDNDDWGLALQEQKEVRTQTMLWIQNIVSTHPEGVNDTTYALAQPSWHLDGDHEKEGLPRPIVVPAPLTQPTSPAQNRDGFEAEVQHYLHQSLQWLKLHNNLGPIQTKPSSVVAQAQINKPKAKAMEAQSWDDEQEIMGEEQTMT